MYRELGGKRAKILLWLITWWFWLCCCCCCCIWYWILYEMASWEEWWPELRILLQNMRSGWLLLLLFTSKVCGRISLERCFWIRKRKHKKQPPRRQMPKQNEILMSIVSRHVDNSYISQCVKKENKYDKGITKMLVFSSICYSICYIYS